MTRWRMAVVATAALLMMSSVTVNASAVTHGRPSKGTDTGSSSGGTKNGSSGDCNFYANPGRFGVACGVLTTTVGDILGHDPAPDCWDEVISATQLVYYGYTVTEQQQPYWLHSCISGNFNLAGSAHNQPDVQINQSIITMPRNVPVCAKPWRPEYLRLCQATLTPTQTTLIGDMAGGSIPAIVVTTHPSTTVRTNTLTGFGDTAFDLSGHLVDQDTPRYTVNGVTMWAHMTRYVIYPYGQGKNTTGAGCYDGEPTTIPTATTPGTCEICDGPTQLTPTSTPQQAPYACWWKYPASSKGQQHDLDAYDFRAEADWTVYYDDGGGQTPFAQFQKYDDLDLPVFDVQSLNLG